MTAKRVVLTAQARAEVRRATARYRNEGGPALARRWADAVENAVRHISAHPATGSTRYAAPLKLREIRFWPVRGFPYLVFYIEREQQVDVSRILHAERDIPASMGALE